MNRNVPKIEIVKCPVCPGGNIFRVPERPVTQPRTDRTTCCRCDHPLEITWGPQVEKQPLKKYVKGN